MGVDVGGLGGLGDQDAEGVVDQQPGPGLLVDRLRQPRSQAPREPTKAISSPVPLSSGVVPTRLSGPDARAPRPSRRRLWLWQGSQHGAQGRVITTVQATQGPRSAVVIITRPGKNICEFGHQCR